MSIELDQIESDTAAVKFALGCLWAATVLSRQPDAEAMDEPGVGNTMGLACGLIAAALGVVYLVMADAPGNYIIVNICATVIGVGCYVAVRRWRSLRLGDAVWVAASGLLLATTVFGDPVEGVTRWVHVGSMSLQLSLMIIPAVVVAYAQRCDVVTTGCVVLVAFALALQPDRAMAGVLAAGTAVLAVRDRRILTLSAAGFTMAGFVATLVRPDALPAVPYVDHILFTAFDVHAMAGCAVVMGALMLIVPAVKGDVSTIFGVVWLAVVAAAAMGNYPTPIVGYGGSAIVGYFLSAAMLPRRARGLAPNGNAGDRVTYPGKRMGIYSEFAVNRHVLRKGA